jgi:tetratricopeptide (TPR) repeat protein
MGLVYFHSYQYDKAYKFLTEISTEDATNFIALKKLKEYFLIQGDIARALALQKQLIKIKPRNVEYYLELEKLYSWNNDPYSALQTKQKRAELYTGRKREQILFEVASGYRWIRRFNLANTLFGELEKSQDAVIMKQMANYFLTTKQPYRAIDILKKVVILDPRDGFFRKLLATTYESLRIFKEAAEEYLVLYGGDISYKSYYGSADFMDSATSEYVKSRLEYVEKLQRIYKTLNFVEPLLAIKEKLFELYSDNPEYQFDLAEAYFELKRYDRAMELFEDMEGIKEDREYYLYEIANRYFYYKESGRQGRAIKFMEELVAREPNNLDFLMDLGNWYEETGQKVKALKVFFRLLEIEVNRQVYWEEKDKPHRSLYPGTLIASNGSLAGLINWDATGPPLNMKTFTPPKDAILLASLNFDLLPPPPKGRFSIYDEPYLGRSDAILSLAQRQHKQSIRELKYRIINILMDLNRYEETLKFFIPLRKQYPGDLQMVKDLAGVYLTLNQSEKAVPLYQIILQSEPRSVDGLTLMSDFYMKQKDYNNTLRYIARLEEASTKQLPLFINIMKEESLWLLQRYQQHERFCQMALNQNIAGGSPIDFLGLQARCLSRLKKREEAITLLENYLENTPNEWSVRTNLIWHYFGTSNFSKIRENLEYLRETNNFKQENEIQEKEMNNYFEELERQEEIEFAQIEKTWHIDMNDLQIFTSSFMYNDFTAEIRKRVRRFGFSAHFKNVIFEKGLSGVLVGLGPRVRYYSDTYSITGQYTYYIGKDIQFPFALNVGWYRYAWLFLSLGYNHGEAQYGSTDLAKMDNASKRGVQMYSEIAINPSNKLEITAAKSTYFYDDSSGKNYELGAQYLYTMARWPITKLGFRVSYSYLNESNIPTDPNQIIIAKNKTWAFLYDHSRLLRMINGKPLFGEMRVTLGGNPVNELGPGEYHAIRFQSRYQFDPEKKFRAWWEYARESSSNTINSVHSLGVTWETEF